MPSIGHFKIYAPVEPCTYAGDELREVIDKILKDRFPESSRELDLQGCCIGPNGFRIVLENDRFVTASARGDSRVG